jgi:BMFP domain-containing protein YqiC
MDGSFLDDFVRLMAQAIPPGARELQQEFERNARALMSGAFSKLDLVTREEFDVQSAVLARTREKVDTLERQVAWLEERLGIRAPASPESPPAPAAESDPEQPDVTPLG